jgi:hypothetical protein
MPDDDGSCWVTIEQIDFFFNAKIPPKRYATALSFPEQFLQLSAFLAAGRMTIALSDPRTVSSRRHPEVTGEIYPAFCNSVLG